ncbi:MAG: hypothetical protein V4684_09795 [Pseudomonadota bacterium]
MNLKTLLIAAVIAIGAPAFAKDDHAAKHGGIFVETKALDFEIVAKPDVIHVYVGDHGKPVKLDGAKGKVTLLNGSEKSEIDLAPAGDKMEAKGSFKVAKGTKGIAIVTLAGKSAATARFEVK